MPWGDAGISKELFLSNGVNPWGGGGFPVSVPVQQTGILKQLRLLATATPTFTPGTGSIAADVLGPWNVFNQIYVAPNQQAPVMQVSGYALYLINLIKKIEGEAAGAPDVSAISVSNAEASGDVFGARATSGTAPWDFFLDVPISQRVASLGGDIGYWPLQNPAMQLQAQFTPNSASTGSPFNAFSTTAGQAPYLVTGNATVTLTNPTVELIRDLYSVPASQADYPPFQLVSTWIEEAPQGVNVNGASSFQWMATPLSGLLARLIVFIYDGGSNNGVAASKLAQSNALQLTYDANTAKFAESASAALARQRDYYRFDLPQGVYCWDLLGRNQTLQDVLNTNTTGNIKAIVSLSSALGGTNSAAKIIKQMISPLEVK